MKIRWKLFITYSSLILLILFISSLIFYRYTTRLLRENGYQSLYQTSLGISDRLDLEMENLDQLATRIIFSDQVSDIWFHNMTTAEGSVNQTSVNRLNSAVYALAGPNLQKWEICLYHANGTVATMGMYSGVSLEEPDTVRESPLFAEALAAKGSKVFSGPYENDWNHQTQVLSVSRCFSSELLSAAPTAVVEVQIEYEHLIKELLKALRSANHGSETQLWIIDPDGTLLYGDSDTSSDIFSLCLEKNDAQDPENWFSFQSSANAEKVAASYVQSDYTGWIVVTALPEALLFESVHAFANWLVIITFFALVCTIFVSYLVSRNLTSPLEKLHKAIRNTVLPYTSPEPEMEVPDKSEPEALYDAYMHLTEQLQSSIERSAQMSIRETQARLSALQSQMNPHFLYNTISSISILSEMGDSEKVIQTCRLLTDMMGYILSKGKKDTVLNDEIRFAEQYLELMKIRYEHYLEWEIEIPEEMRSLPFPRLVLQPLVENAMKYATSVNPPWQIRIRGFLADSDNWRIQVTDNGPGFPEDYLALWNQPDEDSASRFEETSSDGLGLPNTRARFRILYPQNGIFELRNLPEGGASILIGGML
ncbi:MAG: histidine kinase [Eubacteriales bacterium]|nr:histidine kinase [Eubacteriales bacterium]